MIIKGVRKSGEYYDSVTLMLVARSLTEVEGVDDATVVMGTDSNKDILKAGGLYLDTFNGSDDNDLLISVRAEEGEVVEETLKRAEELLKESKSRKAEAGDYQPRSLEGAVGMMPGANMAIVSVAGRYAGDVAEESLDKGMHVMLFSDNVPVETEVQLKEKARKLGLLLMGPDCGTAIINGSPLGFANVVPQGNIGIVAASGTGLQEVSSIVANLGGGISQAIGTGGRDVRREVGGLMFLEGIEALEADAQTEVIVLVSKPPHPEVQDKVVQLVGTLSKPVVAILIGGDPAGLRKAGAHAVDGLEQAAHVAVALARREEPAAALQVLAEREEGIAEEARREATRFGEGQKYLRGLFSGGTLCDETQLVFMNVLGGVYSPAPLDPAFKLDDIWNSRENTVVDLGEDEFTVGRPHPMIDFLLRKKRIVQEARDPETAVILLDVVLGYGSNMAPGEELAPAIAQALEVAREAGRHLAVICSITGTQEDPQGFGKVKAELEGAGATVLPSNAAATRYTVELIKSLSAR